MTHEDDMIVLHTETCGTIRVTCKKVGIDWPPPIYLAFDDKGRLTDALPVDGPHLLFKRVNMSQITDEQIASMSHVCRGAEYERDNP
jgi:hypothetical protein